MTIGESSGTYAFTGGFSNTELIFDSFERIGISPAQLDQTKLSSARRSLNLILQSLATGKGPALWAIELYTVFLQQGIPTITLPANISSVLDCYVRQYINLQTINQNVVVTTNAGQTSVDIYQPAHGLLPGQSVFFVTPIAVGGLILQGYYLVANVPDQNDFTITAATPALTSVSQGGVVPQFTTINTQQNVTVTLPNHGLLAGSPFNVPISTDVGGLTLFGSYMVTSVTDANNFVINAGQAATSSANVFLNSGQMQIQEQTANSVPTDRILTPMSRTDYNSLPYKAQQGFPYSFWADRIVPMTMTFWQVPDQNGPYILNAYCLRQLQDANLGMGEIPDAQFRALEMLTSKLAVKLAVKYAPDRYEMLKLEAKEEFTDWAEEEREKTPLFIEPSIERYFRR